MIARVITLSSSERLMIARVITLSSSERFVITDWKRGGSSRYHDSLHEGISNTRHRNSQHKRISFDRHSDGIRIT